MIELGFIQRMQQPFRTVVFLQLTYYRERDIRALDLAKVLPLHPLNKKFPLPSMKHDDVNPSLREFD